jgi:hypothetical protein
MPLSVKPPSPAEIGMDTTPETNDAQVFGNVIPARQPFTRSVACLHNRSLSLHLTAIRFQKTSLTLSHRIALHRLPVR